MIVSLLESINGKDSRHDVPWNGSDVLKVIAIILASMIVFYIIALVTIGDGDWTFLAFEYAGSFFVGLFPYVWIKRKYLLPYSCLGFRKGKYNLFYSVSISIVLAMACSILFALLFNIKQVPIRISEPDVSIFLIIMLYPISFVGLAGILFVPLSEEMFFRGFLYSYIRKNNGIVVGLLIQSLIFTVLHLGFIFNNEANMLIFAFILGFVSGIIYEYTNSIYPSVVYHSVVNYMVFILGVYPITSWSF